MAPPLDKYWHVRLVTPDDPDYIAFVRRMADRRPSRGGPRAAGEYLGGMVEQAVRYWLGGYVPLQEERILSWEQRLRNGRHATLYRELDAVWTIDPESLCLYEMKLTTPENMERGVGISQLDTATEILFAAKRYRYVLKRLVYVAEAPVTVLEDLLALAPDDEYEEIGVVWVPPAAVETAAQDLGLDLPEDWLQPEAREGFVEDPEREQWRQFADTQERGQEEDSTLNPLAEALRRAMQEGED
ncbi:MAG TPA: hypothetical protein VKT32_16215 [Chthonomonadaceae bacterium]|nr:hypothetical protein [Chthonomonadaceae bacterium]